jgi:dTDP-4-dehydrorhamnose 3,5-epimerase
MRFRPVDDPVGPVLIDGEIHRDGRGAFREAYHEGKYREGGLANRFVQVNVSRSDRSVLRGLHFQHPQAQAKLVWVARGEVFDVAVDIRRGSPSFGRWFGTRLSEENGRQLYVPPDFAHGFLVLSEEADVVYHCSELYHPESEGILRWDDPALRIAWPEVEPAPRLSERDAAAPGLAELESAGRLPAYVP